jgi:hypothetical protein
MRTIILSFIALLAIPVFQVAFDQRFERAGGPVLIDRSGKIIIAVSQHLRARDMGYPTAPRSERRPKAS